MATYIVGKGLWLQERTVLTKKNKQKGNFEVVFKYSARKRTQKVPKMNYLPVEKSLLAVFVHSMPLSSAQTERMARLCSAMVLAGEVQLTKWHAF